MKRFFFFLPLGVFFISCSKEPIQPVNDASARLIEPAAGVNAFPINDGGIFPFSNAIWNPCTNEFVEFSGFYNYSLKGMISDNKITYVLHSNFSGVKGVGQVSGTEYVTTGAFNYNNTDNFGEQLLYQQKQTFNFIARQGEGSFSIINDWHLTINANGEVTFFFTTGGDILTCK